MAIIYKPNLYAPYMIRKIACRRNLGAVYINSIITDETDIKLQAAHSIRFIQRQPPNAGLHALHGSSNIQRYDYSPGDLGAYVIFQRNIYRPQLHAMAIAHTNIADQTS